MNCHQDQACSLSSQNRHMPSFRTTSSQGLDVLQWILISFKNTLLDQLLRVWPVLQPLLQTISPHVVFQLPLLLLQCRRGI